MHVNPYWAYKSCSFFCHVCEIRRDGPPTMRLGTWEAGIGGQSILQITPSLQLRLIKGVLLSPREDDNIPIQDSYTSIIGLNIMYDGGQPSEWAGIISPD